MKDEKQGVFRYMDVSTCHIDAATNQWLTDGEYDALQIIVREFQYGWDILVPDEIPPNTPKPMVDIFKTAQDNKCIWVKLDRDGFEHDDLPKYEW